MDRRRFLASAGASGFVALAGCPGFPVQSQDGDGSATRTETDVPTERTSPRSGDPHVPFRVADAGFERWTGDGYDPLVVRGLNLGMAKPGTFPGQAAITRAEYDRWVAAMGEIANVVRTYTIHPPAFYRALASYNESADDPLLLLQGTWVPTADLIEAPGAGALSGTVDQELRRTVDVLHGETTLPERPGHASGTYDADVSDSTLGLLFGIEWPPEVAIATNERGAIDTPEGRYLRTADASPFERWLAGRLDGAVAYETETYGVQRPAAYVNWVTTDPLEHPYEPFGNEDAVGIDPDTLVTTNTFRAGTFAAYHVYPYYPDLLNETPEYVDYVDHRGERNSYAGYLNDLASATEQTLLIAEFGVPSSRGIAHRDVHGRDQGHHTETEQGEMVAAMYEDILRAGTAGGIAFAWQNEWFKRTWNLDARSVPGRRPLWSNVETPEQRFGLLAFDPVDGVSLDGSDADWRDGLRLSTTGNRESRVRPLEAVRVTHDYEGLAVRLEFATDGSPIDWDLTNALVSIGLTGTRSALPFGVDASATADFAVRLAGPDSSALYVESSYDAFAREFGRAAGLDLEAYRSGAAGFVPVREPINLGYTVPPTGEQVPFEAVETGQLRYGVGNPDSERYDSLTDVFAAPDGSVVELRLPWVLLNVADPSSKRRIATPWDAGLDVTPFETVAVGAGTFEPAPDRDGSDGLGPTNFHRATGVDGSELRTASYGWETWDQVAYEERLKESYEVIRRTGWDGNA